MLLKKSSAIEFLDRLSVPTFPWQLCHAEFKQDTMLNLS